MSTVTKRQRDTVWELEWTSESGGRITSWKWAATKTQEIDPSEIRFAKRKIYHVLSMSNF